MLRLSEFGYHTLIATWLFPFMVMAFVGNANSTGATSDFYAVTAIGALALFAFAAYSAYLNSKTGTRAAAVAHERAAGQTDAVAVSFENLSAWKWVYCFLISIIAIFSAVGHYLVNRNSQGLTSTALLIYAVIDLVIAVISFKQFWDIKKAHIVQLSNKVADNMFQH